MSSQFRFTAIFLFFVYLAIPTSAVGKPFDTFKAEYLTRVRKNILKTCPPPHNFKPAVLSLVGEFHLLEATPLPLMEYGSKLRREHLSEANELRTAFGMEGTFWGRVDPLLNYAREDFGLKIHPQALIFGIDDEASSGMAGAMVSAKRASAAHFRPETAALMDVAEHFTSWMGTNPLAQQLWRDFVRQEKRQGYPSGMVPLLSLDVWLRKQFPVDPFSENLEGGKVVFQNFALFMSQNLHKQKKLLVPDELATWVSRHVEKQEDTFEKVAQAWRNLPLTENISRIVCAHADKRQEFKFILGNNHLVPARELLTTLLADYPVEIKTVDYLVHLPMELRPVVNTYFRKDMFAIPLSPVPAAPNSP